MSRATLLKVLSLVLFISLIPNVSEGATELYTWGSDSSGTLGDGMLDYKTTPVQPTGVTAISAGYSHIIALKNDNTVWAWGNNFKGELGDGTNTNRLTPVQATGLTGITSLSTAGYYHSLALVDIPDTTAPTTTASPVGGTYAGSADVTLTCDDGVGSGCATTYYTTDGSEPTVASLAYIAPINLTADTTLKFFSIDNNANEETVNTEPYIITALPTNSVLINNDDAQVNQRAVTLQINCPVDCVDMRISNDGVNWTTWQVFNAAVDYWTVEWGNGTKTVTVEIRDSVSAVTSHSDTITLKDTSFGGIGGLLLMGH